MTATASIFMIFILSMICSAQDVAMVVDLKKGRAYYETGDRQSREVILMDFLKTGDKIRLEPDTVLVLNYFDPGVREEISGPGNITVGTGSAGESNTAKVIRTETQKTSPESFSARRRYSAKRRGCAQET